MLSDYSQNIAFRDYQYIKINVYLISDFVNIEIYLNFNYLIILNNRIIFIILSNFEK